jgi:hypothetical protein
LTLTTCNCNIKLFGAGPKLVDKTDEKRAEGEVRKRREVDEGR